MTAPGSGTAEPEKPLPQLLAEPELARLYAAGASARFVATAGTVALGLLLILLTDLAVRNPDGILQAASAQPAPTMIGGVLFALAGIGAIALLWSYGRNVAAFLRGESTLPSAFRRIRHFLILWTILTALTALLDFSVAWTRL